MRSKKLQKKSDHVTTLPSYSPHVTERKLTYITFQQPNSESYSL